MKSLRRVAPFILSAALVLSVIPPSASALGLEEAVVRTAAVHPDLRGFVIKRRSLAIEASQADLRPALSAGLELENVAGSGGYSGVDDVEATLTLAGILERGGKRAARQALAATRIDALAVEREAKELDVLAEVARRYLDLAEAQARLPMIERSLERQRELAKAARRRFQEGASPEVLALSAESAITRRALALESARRDVDLAWRTLALMWADSAPGEAPILPARSAELPALKNLETLVPGLRRSPDLRYFAEAERVQDARRRLASAGRQFDLSWQVGVRRFEATDDTALVAGITVPLGMRSRAALDESLEAENLELIASTRDATSLALETMLVRVHGEIASSISQVRALEGDILPRLSKSAAQAQRAYAAGALSYFESMQLQNEITEAEWEALSLRFAIDRKLVELQRLTGEPIVAVGRKSRETP